MIVMLAFAICGCAQTAEETPIAEPKTVEPEDTEIEGEEATDAENAEKIVSEQEEQTKAAQRQWQVYIQPDMPEPFIEVLKQYEDFMNTDIQILDDDAWWYEFSIVDGERGYLYDELCASLMDLLLQDSVKERESEPFRYSLTDLTGDGFPELIMGYYSNYDGETWLYIIYYYSEIDGVKMEHMSRYYTMILYEGGIIGYYSAGAGDHSITYLQFQEETESWERVACIEVYYDHQSDSERYYWGEKLANFLDNEPMSEEEYQEIIERYTAKPVELEWIPLFCGEASEDEAESKTS